MELRVASWLDREFVRLYDEGTPGLDAAHATRDVLGRFDAALRSHGLSLDDTVRTRLFTRDRPARDQGSTVRREILSGRARSSSSSFIAPARLISEATVALELVALRPSQPGAAKATQEYEPPRAPLRYQVYDGLVFLSGVTSTRPTLAEQVAEAVAEIGESLTRAGSGWDRAVRLTCFLDQGQPLAALQQLLRPAIPIPATLRLECEHVEGFAGERALVEIEVTASVGGRQP
jgi:enamine deaminase RidA (YjgF/YER057c/UK114 family)